MKNFVVLLALILVSTGLFAQNPESEVAGVVYRSTHYNVTSFAGEDAAKSTAEMMEALLLRYNELFLFDLSKAAGSFNVTLYADKAAFDKGMEGKTSEPPKNYVFLQYADPKQSFLAAWGREDMTAELAFQGFFQFLWFYVPHPPAWIETGLAYHFWNSEWKGSILTPGKDNPFLQATQDRWNTTPLDVEALLNTLGQDGQLPAGMEYDAWALTEFFLRSPDQAYIRLFGNLLANLSADATTEANSTAAKQRVLNVKAFADLSKDCSTYWNGIPTFKTLLTAGVAKLKLKDYTGATESFSKALELRPSDFQAIYYSALVSYEQKDYAKAENLFAQAAPLSNAPGLIPYSRGLTAFALKKWDDARAYLQTASSENPTDFQKLAQPVIDMIK